MTTANEKLINDVLELSPQMCAFIAEKLIESLDLDNEDNFQVSNEWKIEISQRCKDIDEGRATLTDADQVFAKALGEIE